MLLPALAIVLGMAVLMWSADRFVDGAATTARYLNVPGLLVGVVIVGFGTSAPELVISALASWEGNPGLALGNAYGSNIANVGLILGAAALASPIAVQSGAIRTELPMLLAAMAFAGLLLWDGLLSRGDAALMALAFALAMATMIRIGLRTRGDALGADVVVAFDTGRTSRGRALFWLVAGLVLLVASSRALVWGAEAIASAFGVSDLVIGLTVVAVGTSLPELGSSIAAARRGEDDLAFGNVIGSGLFNTLAVVGLSGLIQPSAVPAEALWRDLPVMGAMTLALVPLAYASGRAPLLDRRAGGLLLAVYLAYTAYVVAGVAGAAPP